MTHPATQYALDVVEDRIVTGDLVRHACRRHLDDLEAGERDMTYPFYFDEDAANLVLDFCPHCHHFEGEWAGQVFNPEPWQVFILGSIFGWLRRADFSRRFRKAFIMVARKNGKTLFAAVVGYYCLLQDGEPGSQIISFANSLDQVETTLFRAAEEVRERSPVIKRKVGRVSGNLHVLRTASFWRPLANNSRKWDGLNAHLGLSDETHEHDGRTYRVVESSMGSRRQPLMLAITTAGFDHAGFGGQLYDYMKRVVTPKSEVENDEAFAYIAQLDKDDDPDDEHFWIKANPNLGVSKKIEWLRGEWQKSKGMPSERGNFLTKELNIWTTQTETWLDLRDWDACAGPIDPDRLRGQRAIAGVDLSSTTDLSSLVLIFWELDPLPVLPFFWHPEENLREGVERDEVPYDTWADAGLIELTPGNVIDYDYIEHRLEELSREYQILQVGYDPHHALQFAIHLEARGFQPVRIDQNHAFLHEPCKSLETRLSGRRLAHGGHPVLRWNAQNAAVKRNASGEIKPVKVDGRKRIDGISALVNALALVVRQPQLPPEEVVFHRPPSSRPRDFMEFGQ